MTAEWQPGIPIYDLWRGESVYSARRIVQLVSDDPAALIPGPHAKLARWPEPYDWHDLDAQEGPR